MGRKAQTTELSTEVGINYIPCCKIVLMFYNAEISAVSMASYEVLTAVLMA